MEKRGLGGLGAAVEVSLLQVKGHALSHHSRHSQKPLLVLSTRFSSDGCPPTWERFGFPPPLAVSNYMGPPRGA